MWLGWLGRGRSLPRRVKHGYRQRMLFVDAALAMTPLWALQTLNNCLARWQQGADARVNGWLTAKVLALKFTLACAVVGGLCRIAWRATLPDDEAIIPSIFDRTDVRIKYYISVCVLLGAMTFVTSLILERVTGIEAKYWW